MTIQPKFRKGEERVITSYDFYDLAAGVGYKILNGTDTQIKNVVTHFLTPNTFYAHTGYTSVSGKTIVNYDMPVNLPLTIGGDVIYEVNFTSDNVLSCFISAGLFVVDAGVETQIGEYTNGGVSIPANGST